MFNSSASSIPARSEATGGGGDGVAEGRGGGTPTGRAPGSKAAGGWRMWHTEGEGGGTVAVRDAALDQVSLCLTSVACIYVYTYVHIDCNIHIHTYMRIYIYIYLYIYIYKYTYVYMYIYMYMKLSVLRWGAGGCGTRKGRVEERLRFATLRWTRSDYR